MGVKQEFIDVEDFEEAYECRKEDFNTIKNKGRKIFCIHLGGIVMECLIKKLVIYKYDITKRKKDKKSHWYSECRINLLEDKEKELKQIGKQLEKKMYADAALKSVGNSHDFPTLIARFLKLDISSINDDLQMIFNPLDRDKECFIDLRYCSEDEISDDMYSEWKTSYKKCKIWIENQMENISKEDYVIE
ncbi:hypothetical protein [Tepidibacter sp. Z1-5]|uniref:hypothetical protein n=1 Tax=Tepidibacter sp. Z1-5 TaxID=3134138 RepID=UPI0030C2184D